MHHLDIDAVLLADFSHQIQRFGVQAPGVEDEDADRQLGAGDGVRQHHVFGRQAARQRGRRMMRRDALQGIAQEFCVHERRRNSGCGLAAEAE